LSIFSGERPGPSSRTATETVVGVRAKLSVTPAPGGLNLMALLTRLATTW
jgi:hypothetical protein